MTIGTLERYEGILAAAKERRQDALAKTGAFQTTLPLRYLRQQAHLTAPASNPSLAEKAIAGGFGVASRLLDRYGITIEELAERLGVETSHVREVLAGDTSAPVVMLDLEDGVAPDRAAEARENAVRLFATGKWGNSLRFFRPAGLDDERCADDIIHVLIRSGEGLPPDHYPIDGLVFPKIRHVHEVEWLCRILDDVEAALGLPRDRIRISLLIESGWGVLHLPDLVAAGIERLGGLIFGSVDFSADIHLPEVRYRHPLLEWARYRIVTAAGAAGVPAIDAMTLNFPVGRPDLSPAENKELVLTRMRENFDDTLYSIDLGMSGRWVGHPLQLLATMLAFRAKLRTEDLEAEARKVEEFARAIAAGKGAVAGSSSELLDIATDRHARNVLRRATALGGFPKARALALGIITEEEARDLP